MMENKFVRVKCREKLAFIKLTPDEMTKDLFLRKAFELFGVKQHINFHVDLFDNFRTPVDDLLFKDVVETFHDKAGFYLELKYGVDFDKTTKIVTPYILEEYLIQTNLDWIIREYDEKKDLSELARQQLVNALVDFIRMFFHVTTIQKTHKVMTLSVVLQMFPELVVGDQIEHFMNSMCGYMENRMKCLAKKQKKMETNVVTGDSEVDASANVVPNDTSDEDLQSLVDRMKSVVINESSLDNMKNDLRISRDYRCKMLLNAKTDLLESYPYFFTNIDLILFEFRDRFKDVDDMAFINKWKTFGPSFMRVLNEHYKTCLFYSGWSPEIEQIFVPLKLFPASKVGRNANANNKTFQTASNSLIVFRLPGASPEQMKEKSNDYPYIVAVGNDKINIMRFYIEVERHFIPLPDSLNFAQVIDIFFKIHKIFNLNFDKSIANAMYFIQHYMYEMNDSVRNPTPRMEDVYNRLMRDINNAASKLVTIPPAVSA